jgi:hypothetical protein
MSDNEFIGTATYSPEDNKLRIYPHSRLSKDLYQRVRRAGFIWAPKQELFVAPMWTPNREDLLIELCGEIGDEDTSLVDRAEMRADRFNDYSHKRLDEANRAHDAVERIYDHIPLGQPIIVGHHSERRDRTHPPLVLHRTPLPAFATTHDSARVLEAPGSGKNFPRHDSGDVPHRADGGCSPRSGVVRPELLLALTVTDDGRGPLRPDDFRR